MLLAQRKKYKHQYILLIYLCSIFFYKASLASTVIKKNYPIALYSVILNNIPTRHIISILNVDAKQLWLSEKTLSAFRIKKPKSSPIASQGVLYYDVNSLPQTTFHIDATNGKLYLNILPIFFLNYDNSFSPSLSLRGKTNKYWGAYLNYDMFSQKTEQQPYATNVLLSSHIFNPQGRLDNDFVVKNNPTKTQMLRLDSAWIADIPTRMQTWQLGDALTNPDVWGSSVSFGGIQWRTNFSTQPNFSTLPLPTAKGIAVMPSTVDLYVDNILQKQMKLPTGPFDISNIPITDGQGDIHMLVKNVLGKQYVVDVPYYANAQLLKKGLSDFSVSIGLLRKNYGIKSNDYGNWVASGLYHYGITNQLTSGLHIEMTHKTQAIGLNTNITLYHYATLSLAAALSHQPQDNGQLIEINLNRQTARYSAGIQQQFTTQHFSLVGIAENKALPSEQTDTYFSIPVGQTSSAGISYLRQRYFTEQADNDLDAITMHYSMTITKSFFLTASLLYTFVNTHAYTALLSLTYQFSHNKTIINNIMQTKAGTQGTLGFEKNMPYTVGLGYSARMGLGQDKYTQGNVSYQNNVGEYSLSLAKTNQQTNYQAEARGAVAFLKNHVYFSKAIFNSFAIVHVPELQNVAIYQENRLVAKTNTADNVMIPDLIPYIENKISIHPDQIPLDVKIQQDKIMVIPPNESGIYINFPIHKIKQAILTVTLPSGKFVPVGSTAIATQLHQFSLVADDGLLYFSNLADKNTILIKWEQYECHFTLSYPKHTKSPLPHLGVHICYANKTKANP